MLVHVAPRGSALYRRISERIGVANASSARSTTTSWPSSSTRSPTSSRACADAAEHAAIDGCATADGTVRNTSVWKHIPRSSRSFAAWTNSCRTTRPSTSGTSRSRAGDTLEDAKLAYKTFGELNADKSNAIVYPTWYSGFHWDNEWLIGEGMALDPAKYFIIVPNMLGNGLSTSPSNTPPPHDKANFPNVTFYDQVEAQHKLVAEHFGIETLPLVTGWSMGAGQTYQWAVSYPDMVQRAAPFCGSSKTSEHNFVFLEGVKAALTGGDSFKGGFYDEKPEDNLRTAARVYAGWGFSQAFFWDRVYTDMGHSYRLGIDLAFPTLEDFLVQYWEGHFLDRRDVNDLLSMLWTWQYGDIGADARVRRRPRQGAAVDQGQAHRHARREGPVLPAGGRGVRVAVHPQRRGPGDPGRVGSLRGQR